MLSVWKSLQLHWAKTRCTGKAARVENGIQHTVQVPCILHVGEYPGMLSVLSNGHRRFHFDILTCSSQSNVLSKLCLGLQLARMNFKGPNARSVLAVRTT